MKEKRYSIAQIQKIIDISPNDLQKMIRKNSSRIKLKTVDMPDGSKEAFLDEESFKKLLFIKQLEMGIKLSVDEVCELIKEKKLNADHEYETKVEAKADAYAGLDRCLQSVEEEVNVLRTQMNRMVIKYDHCIKELNISRSKNIVLENEMKRLKTREAALMGQLRNVATETYDDDLSQTDLN